MKKQHLLLTVLTFVLIQGVQAQDTPHEFSFMVGIGPQGLKYSVENGKNSFNFGVQTGLGYTYFLNEHIGIVTGLEYGVYNSTATIKDGELTRTHYTSDLDPTNPLAFDYVVSTIGYEEKQKVSMLNIPLMAHYQRLITDDMQLYFRGGFRFGIPISGTNSATAMEIAGRGDYGSFTLPSEPGNNEHGFAVFDDWSLDQDLKIKMSYSLCLEAGVNYVLSPDWKIYGGLFFDYGLNNVKDAGSESSSMLEWAPEGVTKASVSNLMNVEGKSGTAKLLAFGLKIRIAFTSFGAK